MRCVTRRNWLQLATLALVSQATTARSQIRDRSVLDDLPRQLDEFDLPQMPERQSQLGFEVRTKEFVVVAKTSMEDARTAARQLQAVWRRSGDLADHWTKVHRRPSFGIGTVQLLIDNEPVRQQDAPLVTLNVVGVQTQIAINVSPGQPSLQEQLPRIREATAWAFLHTAEFDTQFPTWVCYGLANFIANEGSPVTAQVAELLPRVESLGGQQWKGVRIEPGTLDFPANHRTQAALHVRYLLEGNDAELAPQFFAALRQTERGAQQYWAQERRDSTRQADQQLRRYERAVNELADKNAVGFETWLKDPEMGQPVFEPLPGADREMVALQKQMTTVLKLGRRFSSTTRAASAVRVASFDPDRREAVAEEASPQVRTLDGLYRDLTDPKQPEWATIGPDGKLLFSTETRRIRELLAIDSDRFRASTREGHWTLSAAAGYRSRIQGWLEENEKDPSRPLAKFAMTDTTTGQRQ